MGPKRNPPHILAPAMAGSSPLLKASKAERKFPAHAAAPTLLARADEVIDLGSVLQCMSLVMTRMYGPAVRCKRFSSIRRMRSCINVSGL